MWFLSMNFQSGTQLGIYLEKVFDFDPDII